MRYDLDSSIERTASESLSQPAAQLPSWLGLESHRLVRLSVLLIILGMLALVFVTNFRIVVVDGHSMEPTYSHGQRVLMTWNYWLFGPIRRGDVVVIQLPGGTRLIKRVIALGGEEVPRPYWGPMIWRMGRRVPPGYVYVVGDNMERSEDSRQLGPFPLTQVQGKIVGGYKPLP
ncbi:Signal peptidase I S [bacterium HR15]|nr:Signal peptidase I S [bacterium HR15]